MGDRRGACWVLVGIPEEWRPFGRPGHRWEDNIKLDRQEMVWGGLQVAKNRDGWQVLVNEPSGSIKGGEFLEFQSPKL
jgi:hypothetical protein